ncbi:Isoleucyl-tRNA synthetase IleS [Mycobacteroides abscessus subsp. abscessus]|nr:Isoleucyl-tRNA synthetase IleS [Mycobacteroides abscessus subsp. abscessus]
MVLEVPAVHRAWAERHRELISGEILATTLDIAEAGADTRTPATALSDGVRVSLKKAAG